jgi:general nucleoside transport system permease protein
VNHSVVVQSAVDAIVLGTPVVFAAVGEVLGERSGVMNLALDGIMLVGAVTAFGATNLTGDVWIGLLVGALAGATISLLHAALSVSLRVSQILSGLALGIMATGLSSFVGSSGNPPLTGQSARATFHSILHGGLTHLPVVGPLLFGQDPIVYLSWVFTATASYYLFHTRVGLSTRAVGEDPAAADVAGISVVRTRYLHVVVGGAAAGIGGAYFSLALFPSWQDGITSGAGWIALGLVVFSGWRPWRALVAAYLFGAISGLNFTLQTLGVRTPAEILAMMPYVMTIIVLILISSGNRGRRLGAPAGLALPYVREAR